MLLLVRDDENEYELDVQCFVRRLENGANQAYHVRGHALLILTIGVILLKAMEFYIPFLKIKSENVIRGFAAFDLSNNTIRFWFVHLLVDFAHGLQARSGNVCCGLVRGRPQLSQFFKIERKFVVKVWELNHSIIIMI